MDFSGMTLTEATGNAEGIDMTTSTPAASFVIRPLKGEGGRNGKISNIYQLDMSDATSLVMATEFACNLMTWCMSPPRFPAGTV